MLTVKVASGPNKYNVSLLYKNHMFQISISNPIGKKLNFSVKKNENLKSPQLEIHLPIHLRGKNNFGWPQVGVPFLGMSPGH